MPRPLALVLVLVILHASGPANALADDATPGPAASPVDQDVLPSLTIHAFPPDVEPEMTALGTFGHVIALQPGDTVVLALGVYDYEQCGVSIQCFIPVEASVTWLVTPSAGARIDPVTGELTIEETVPSGSRFTVTAKVENDRNVVTTEVYVYTEEGNPLVGFWREVAQLACDDGTDVPPDLRIEELVFAADGSFAVTWQPFESYVDYWGDYEFDLLKGTLELTVTGGNHVPDDVDGQGQFAVDEAGNLTLSDLWLGTSHSTTGPPNCGHRFSR